MTLAPAAPFTSRRDCIGMLATTLLVGGCAGQGRGETSGGLDPETMARTLAMAEKLPRLRSLLVLRGGEQLAAHRFNAGPPLDQPVNIKSASKSVLSALVGIAIDRGLLKGVDQPVMSVLASEAPASPDPRLSEITVRHLLSMQSGLEPTSGPNYGAWVSSPNWVQDVLARPFVDLPGGANLYSTGSSHLLSAMLTRASGRSTHELMQQWLGNPLNIVVPPWTQDPQGIFFGGNNMLLSPLALARFGELYRLDGAIGGNQIVPAAWIEASWTPRSQSLFSGRDYGYGWFLGRARRHPLRFAWGYGGQMIYIVRKLGLTVVMTSETDAPSNFNHLAALHSLLTDGIVPAAEQGAR
jgi:CubicO group peptidase (beta-lactamase class C family)